MASLRTLPMPLLTVTLTVGLAAWAWPEDLPPLRTAGIVVGWAACGLLLASLLLMVREARLASLLGGLERMYRWHHYTGMLAYLLLLAHPLVLACEAWRTSPQLAWQVLSPLAQGRPVQVGWLSLLLMMLGLGATLSSRIGYARWRRLHVGLGLAVLLGLWHLALLGIDEPVWPFMVVAMGLLGWRMLRGDLGLAAHPYVVGAVDHVGDGMVELTLQPLGRPVLPAAGQFVLVAFFSGANFRGCGEFHPFTVSARLADGALRIAVKALGDCTRHIQSIETGVMARVQGGFGAFLSDRPPGPQLWVAGGIGIAPFLAVLREGPLSQPTDLLYLYRHDADAAYLAELAAIAAGQPQLSLHALATGDDPSSDLSGLLAGTRCRHPVEAYLCGPPGLVAALEGVLRARGIGARHIHCDNFGFRP